MQTSFADYDFILFNTEKLKGEHCVRPLVIYSLAVARSFFILTGLCRNTS
jgi:hypothetical protein